MRSKLVRGTMLFLAACTAQLQLSGAVIGNWSGSGRTWNGADFTAISALMTAAGHTVEANEALTAANLLNNTHYLLGEPSVPTAVEIADLSGWLNNGGILMVLVDSGGTGATGANAFLAGIGSAITAGGSPANASVKSGVFASEGPPFNIVGTTLTTSPGTAMNGGNELAGTYVRWEQIGSGFVFAFADRVDHNTFSPSASNPNGQLFLNIAGGGSGPGPGPVVPEPSTAWLLGGGLLGAFWLRRRNLWS